MKTTLAFSLTVLVCGVVVGANLLAQQPNNTKCTGPRDGCGVTVYCFADPGQCDEGPNYAAYDQLGWPDYQCTPLWMANCANNAYESLSCSYHCFKTKDVNGCSNNVCEIDINYYECNQNQ